MAVLTDLQVKVGREVPHENCLWLDTSARNGKAVLKYYSVRLEEWLSFETSFDPEELERILSKKADLIDGKVPLEQLPDFLIGGSGLIYEGVWDPQTNIPTLINGDTLNHGHYYVSINKANRLGYSWQPSDIVLNDNGIWKRVEGWNREGGEPLSDANLEALVKLLNEFYTTLLKEDEKNKEEVNLEIRKLKDDINDLWEALREKKSGEKVIIRTSTLDNIEDIPTEGGVEVVNTPNGTTYIYKQTEPNEDGEEVITSAFQYIILRDAETGNVSVKQRVYGCEDETWGEPTTIIDTEVFVTKEVLSETKEEIENAFALTINNLKVEFENKYQPKESEELETESKSIVGAINELNAKTPSLDGLVYNDEGTTIECGGVPVGTVFENTPILDVIRMMLHGNVEPQPYTPFSFEVIGDGESFYEQNSKVTFTLDITEGSEPIVSANVNGIQFNLETKQAQIPYDATIDYVVTLKDASGRSQSKTANVLKFYKVFLGRSLEDDGIPTTLEGVLKDGVVTDFVHTLPDDTKNGWTQVEQTGDTEVDDVAEFMWFWIAFPKSMQMKKIYDGSNAFEYQISKEGEFVMDGIDYEIWTACGEAQYVEKDAPITFRNYFSKGAEV